MARQVIPINVIKQRKVWSARRAQLELLWADQQQALDNNFDHVFPTVVSGPPTGQDPEGWYADPTNSLVYLREGLAMYAFTAVVTNPAAPTLTSATVAANGTSLTLVFSAALSGSSSGWTLTEGTTEIDLLYASGATTNTHVYTIDGLVLLGQTIRINYDAPADGLAAGAYKMPLAPISAGVVVNNSTQEEPEE